jgi:hypothetical protein
MTILATSGSGTIANLFGGLPTAQPVKADTTQPPKPVPSGVICSQPKISGLPLQRPLPVLSVPSGRPARSDPLPPPPPYGAQPASPQVPPRPVSTGTSSAAIRTPSAPNNIQAADRKTWESNYGNLSRQPAYESLARPFDANDTVKGLYHSLTDQMNAGRLTWKQRFELLVRQDYFGLWLNPSTGPAMVWAWRELNNQWVKPWQAAKPLPEFDAALRITNLDDIFPPANVNHETGEPLPWRNPDNLKEWEMRFKVAPHAQTYGWSDIDRQSTGITATYTGFTGQYNRLLDAKVPELLAKQKLLSGAESLWRDKEYGPVMLYMWNKNNSRLTTLGQPAIAPPQFLLVPSPTHQVEVLPAVQNLSDLYRSFSHWLPGYNAPEPDSYKGSGNPKPWAQLMADGRKELIEMRFWPLAQSYDNFIRNHLGSVDESIRAALFKEQKQLIDWIKSEPDSLAAKRIDYFQLENTLATASGN